MKGITQRFKDWNLSSSSGGGGINTYNGKEQREVYKGKKRDTYDVRLLDPHTCDLCSELPSCAVTTPGLCSKQLLEDRFQSSKRCVIPLITCIDGKCPKSCYPFKSYMGRQIESLRYNYCLRIVWSVFGGIALLPHQKVQIIVCGTPSSSQPLHQIKTPAAFEYLTAKPELINFHTKQFDTLDDSLPNTLDDSLRDTLDDSLRDTLDDSLRDILDDSLRDTLDDSLCETLDDSLRDTLDDSLRDTLDDSLRDTLDDSLRDTLDDSLCDTLDDSLRYTMDDSLRDTLDDSLRDTMDDSLRNTLDDSLRYTMDDSLRYTMDDSLRYTMDDSLRDTLDDSLRDTLDDSLRDTLDDSLRDTFNPQSPYTQIIIMNCPVDDSR
ncbi:hypothetical protein J6590_006324 [Homalodisca vitripennis]|nr:hypothetical protein J6590_006324 [Homalodisca vitripennis]